MRLRLLQTVCAAAFLCGCRKPAPPSPPPAADPMTVLAARFETRLALGNLPDPEALAFVRMLGPLAVPSIGRQQVPADPHRRKSLATILASAAQSGFRDESTSAISRQLCTDPDEETRRIARDAVLWSRIDPDPVRDDWIQRNEDVRKYQLNVAYSLPDLDQVQVLIERDLRDTGLRQEDFKKSWTRMPVVKGPAGLDASMTLPGSEIERLCWLVQGARCWNSNSFGRLVDYLEIEPCMMLGRTPSEPERYLASFALRGITGRKTLRYSDWRKWVASGCPK